MTTTTASTSSPSAPASDSASTASRSSSGSPSSSRTTANASTISASLSEGSRTANPFTATAAPSSLRAKAMAAAGILAVFTIYSMWVVLTMGYTGFLSLAMREPWAMQLLADLVIACTFGVGWMVHDARRRSIATWPFVIATVFLGSIGLLGYVVWRGFAPHRSRG